MTQAVKGYRLFNARLPSPLLHSVIDREIRWQRKDLVFYPSLSPCRHPCQGILRQGYRHHMATLHHLLANIVSLCTLPDISPSQRPYITKAQATETSKEEGAFHGISLARRNHQQFDFLYAEITTLTLLLAEHFAFFFL